MSEPQMPNTEYAHGYENGFSHGRAAGKRDAAKNMRTMFEIMTKDRDQDIARCAALLLEGFNDGMGLA